jgi:hypothetical protein
MKTFALFTFLTAVWLNPTVVHATDACSTALRVLPSISSTDLNGCVCDKSLKNLHGNLKPPFRIVAACHLRWSSGKQINLTTEQISLKQFTNGHYPEGVLYVSGSATFDGVLTNDEMGSVSVRLNKPLMHGGPVSEFDYLKIDEFPRNVSIPARLRGMSCLEGSASVTVKGLRIIFGGNDEAGAWPLQHKFRKASLEKACKD